MYVLRTCRNLVGVKSGSNIVILTLFWKKFYSGSAYNVKSLFSFVEHQGSFLLYYKDVE